MLDASRTERKPDATAADGYAGGVWSDSATRGLAIFAALGCLGASALAWWVPGPALETTRPTPLHYTGSWLRGDARFDSWKPMREAREILRSPGRKSLYERIWFKRRMKFQYPPSSLLLLAPLEALPLGNGTSDAVLNSLSWLAVLATAGVVARILVLCVRRAGPASRSSQRWLAVLAVGLSLTFYPLLRGYFLGQIQTWIDLLSALLIWAWLAERPGLAGVCAGLACAIKPPRAGLLLWGALRREWRFDAGLLATAGAALALAVAAYGLENHTDYLRMVRVMSRQGESYYPNQSMNGLLHRALHNGPNLEWQPHRFAPYHGAVFAGTLLSSALWIGVALFWRRPRGRGAGPEDLGAALLGFTLASPIVWDHHYGVALPLFAVALPAVLARARGRPWPVAALGLAYLLVASDFPGVHALARTPWSFLQSFTFFGGVLLLALLVRLRGQGAEPPSGAGSGASAGRPGSRTDSAPGRA